MNQMTKGQEALQRLREGNQRFASEAERIEPAVVGLLAPQLGYDRATLIHKSVRANVRQSVEQLRHGSKILEHLIDKDDQLLVVGAECSLETGRVEFLDDNPDPAQSP